MADRKYRVAVVGGAGTWGRFYARAYAEHPDCEIVALVDRARDRRKRFAEHFGIEQVYDTVEELLVRDTPDIVSAILPVVYTYDAVMACAEAGVRVVFCEKPIAAQLSRADELVRVCRERGTALGCSAGRWSPPYSAEAIDWIHAGHIGKLTAAAIPGGLPTEVSGGGCHQLTLMRFLTGMEVDWVEAWTSDALPGYAAPQPKTMFVSVVEQLVRAFDAGTEAECRGHDYRQALEIAVAMKLSAHRDHQRVELPLKNRSLKLYPHPYRMYGGDEAGWQSIGYKGPPEVL